MKLSNILFIIFFAYCSYNIVNADTWFNLFPYTNTDCSGSMYGMGMSISTSHALCSTNVLGYLTQRGYQSNATTAGFQFYSSYPSTGLCGTQTFYTSFVTNKCQDGSLFGMSDPMGIKLAANYYVNTSAEPYIPATFDALYGRNVLYIFFSTDCGTVVQYQYFVGNTTITDDSNSAYTYKFYCSSGYPYRQTCYNGVCNAAQSLASTCVANSGFFLAKGVICV